MKKINYILIGMLIGVLITTASTVIAEEINNYIGRTIQGQFPVKVDGEYIADPAIVIDGKSFLPVREFASTVGYAVYFDSEGGIKLEPDMSQIEVIHGMGAQAMLEQEQMNAAIEQENAMIEMIGDKKRAIKLTNSQIEILQDQIDREQAEYDDYNQRQLNFIELHDQRSPTLDSFMAEVQTKLNQLNADKAAKQAELATLEQELSDLEAQQ